MEFTARIKFGNEAMETGDHLAEALRRIANTVESSDEVIEDHGIIRDLNGNTVGKWEITQ